ncbi:hypothetical protein OQA88_683 [Cercophora sp. LCS_1]
MTLPSEKRLHDMLSFIGADMWVKRLVTSRAYGFHHSITPKGRVDNVTTYFLGTCVAWCVWVTTTRSNSDFVSTKGLVFSQPSKFNKSRSSGKDGGNEENEKTSQGGDAKDQDSTGKEITLKFLDCLDFFTGEFSSPLSLPFVMATYTFSWIEEDLVKSLDGVRGVIKITGHGDSIHKPQLEMTMDKEKPMTTAKRMGATHDIIINAAKHVDIVIPLLDRILGSPQLHAPFNSDTDCSILSAARLLRCQVDSAGKQCQYLENRSRNQSDVLFAYLTHEDSESNMKIAGASKALAEAASRDASSMKTVAVLTMAFLPATFLAALFSVPSLGWDQPDKFRIYWACAVPTTIVVFALWAVLTPRRKKVQQKNSVQDRDLEKADSRMSDERTLLGSP